jgi:hypothetical protein
MLEHLHEQIRALLRAKADPRQLFRDMPSEQLAELAEAAYQAAFWTAYERNRRGEQSEMILRMGKDELWEAATHLPPVPTLQEAPEDFRWLLEASGDLLTGVRNTEGLRDGLSASQLRMLLEQLGEAQSLVRCEVRRRGLVSDVVRLLPG